jgi:cobalt-zinc-cadmium efflux system membrane fusion protein
MFMNAEIEVQSSNSWTLPSDAVVSFKNKQYVFIAKGKNSFEMIEIKTGNTENGFTEIRFDNNLSFEQSNFVIGGAYNLLMKVKNAPDE